MPVPQVVLDTNVVYAALRSRRGASFRLLSLVGTDRFDIHLSVPLVLDYLCQIAHLHEVYFLWRPSLKDPRDEIVLELAVGARCDTIVTYNKRDFSGVDRFGITVLDAREMLGRLGESNRTSPST